MTNHLTQDVAAIPFLWIVPLAAYLLSFILCFEAPRLYNRAFFLPLLVAALTFMMQQMWTDGAPASLVRTVEFLAVSLFVVCMVCHGELARLKPHSRHLTGFYVIVSLGGAMGGLFVGLAAPNLFRAYYEFPLGLGICAAVLAVICLREAWTHPAYIRYAASALVIAALGRYLWGVGHILNRLTLGYRLVARNFYGQLRVLDDGDPEYQAEASRTLVHGTINHGAQFQREEYRRLPVTYFCPESGVGRGMRALGGEGRRIGVIGMGCGTLAAYAKPGDTLRIYEINPLVWQIARTQFTYLKDTPAKLDVAMGDARLTLESEPSQQFDILVVDAFSGDAVPVHLLTVEAFRTYFRHLKPGGILALNTTNRYLDLNPVMAHAAAKFGKIALHYAFISSPDEFLCFDCDWTLIMDRSSLAWAPRPGTRRRRTKAALEFPYVDGRLLRTSTASCAVALPQPRSTQEFRLVAREHSLERWVAHVARYQFAQHVAEIGGQRQVAAFVELLALEARPLAVDFAALHAAAHHEHTVGVAVIGAAVAVFLRGAAEFGHGDNHHILHAVAHILPERGQRLAEFAAAGWRVGLRSISARLRSRGDPSCRYRQRPSPRPHRP